MSNSLEILFTPADFEALKKRDLSDTVCVVFDVLRATSSMVTALANGAKEIIPVAEISKAIALRKTNPDILLAGERDGVLITAEVSGSIDFDFGNSPREFTPDRVRGRSIGITTTNGTRALRACAEAKAVYGCSFLNVGATASAIKTARPENLLVICSGTYEHTAYEDVLGAGALCQMVGGMFQAGEIDDSAMMARRLYEEVAGNLEGALGLSKNGQRLLSRPELNGDVAFCAQRDRFGMVVMMADGETLRGNNLV